jgi:cob(I)alamin adenosyltransferase
MKAKDLYTSNGDLGFTCNSVGSVMPKSCANVVAVGKIDTACAALGVALSELNNQEIAEDWREASKPWRWISGFISSTPFQESYTDKFGELSSVDTTFLDKLFNALSVTLDAQGFNQKDWIDYGWNGPIVAKFDFACCLFREAECLVVELVRGTNTPGILKFINKYNKTLYLQARSLSFKPCKAAS